MALIFIQSPCEPSFYWIYGYNVDKGADTVSMALWVDDAKGSAEEQRMQLFFLALTENSQLHSIPSKA